MKFRLIVLVFLLVPASSAWAQAHFWSQRFGGTSGDQGYAVAVDASGNVIVTGYFENTVDFGGGNLTSAGSNDIFVAKYDASGAHQWSQRFGGTGVDRGYAVAVDASGNVIVTGYFENTVDFGGGNLTSAGIHDIFVAKYDASGVHQWSQRFGGLSDDTGFGVAADASGNVIVTGNFRLTVDFGGGDLTSAGVWDIFVAKYDTSGAHQWSQRFGGTGDDRGYGVMADASGNVIVTGYFQNTVDFGGGNLMSAGSNDVFVAKYDASGAHQWSQHSGGTGVDDGYGVAADASGNVIVTGYFQNTVDFGGGNLASAGSYDIFVAKYDANGLHQWSQRFGDTSEDRGYGVTADASGNVIVTGIYQNTADFGGGNLASAGSYDIFVAKYDTNGVHQWSQRFGGTSADQGYAVTADASGNVIVTGIFQNTVDFGGGNLTSAGGSDIFVAKYGGSATGINPQPAPGRTFSTVSYPNPFNPGVAISYTLPEASSVRLDIFDVQGKYVATLLDRYESEGEHLVPWDATGHATGVYFYRLSAGSKTLTKKMALLK